jgi:hypothetical protein
VSEGQFAEVLLVELMAIQEACVFLSSKSEDYRPGLLIDTKADASDFLSMVVYSFLIILILYFTQDK